MTIKNKGRIIGRMIKKITGLHLTEAMTMGRMIAQDKEPSAIASRFPTIFSIERYECCSYPIFHIKGKKATVKLEYSLSLERIAKELRITGASCIGSSWHVCLG